MVLLHVKKGNESQFLFETTTQVKTEELIGDLCAIFNDRLKIERVTYEMEELGKHGTYLPPNIIGLTYEQVEELKLIDEWAEVCVPSGGFTIDKDPIGRRSGRKPNKKMHEVLTRVIAEVKEAVSNKTVTMNIPMTKKFVHEQLEILRGAVTIVYPMNLPPHDPIRMEFEGNEDLSGTQASLQVLNSETAELWFCGKRIFPHKKLGEFLGFNEKTKCIVKLQKPGSGPPGREPIMNADEQKKLMLEGYRRQEELKVRI